MVDRTMRLAVICEDDDAVLKRFMRRYRLRPFTDGLRGRVGVSSFSGNRGLRMMEFGGPEAVA